MPEESVSILGGKSLKYFIYPDLYLLRIPDLIKNEKKAKWKKTSLFGIKVLEGKFWNPDSFKMVEISNSKIACFDGYND